MADDPYTIIIALDDKVMKKFESKWSWNLIFLPSYESFVKLSFVLDASEEQTLLSIESQNRHS